MDRRDRHKALEGIDAAPLIRQAQREIAQGMADARRRREVDGPVREQKLTLDTMIFKVGDHWKMETIREATPGLETLTVHEADERFLVAEMRWALADRLLSNRVVGSAEDARHIAANAVILVHGRVT